MTHASPQTDRHCFGCDRPMINRDYCQFCGEYYPGPLGVQPWRLLFRAHRDGWELLVPVKDGGYYYRSWYNSTTEQTFTLTTKRAVR